MQRCTVTIFSDAGGSRPTILVPFQPSALVSALKDELFKRTGRQNLPVTTDTHHLTLRLNSQTGAVADPQDLLSDVVFDSENIFAIFSRRDTDSSFGSPYQPVQLLLQLLRPSKAMRTIFAPSHLPLPVKIAPL